LGLERLLCGWSILSGTLKVPYTCCIRHENWLGYLCLVFSSPHPHVQYLGDLLTAPVDSSLLQLVCCSNCLALSSFSGEKCPPLCYYQVFVHPLSIWWPTIWR
jgi:hypothetical protein